MKFMNLINKKHELLVPNWLTVFFVAEWIFNSHLDYKPFIGGFILLIGAIQGSPESKLTQWLNYSFRAILIVAIMVVSHPNEFWTGLAKLGI